MGLEKTRQTKKAINELYAESGVRHHQTNKPTKLNRHGHTLVDTKYQRQQWNTSN